MNQFTADYLANLTADLSAQVLNALGKRLRTALQGTEGEQALERAVRAGLAAMLAVASSRTREDYQLLEDIFTAFFSEPDVAQEIGGLLRGRELDREELHFLFAEAGFDEETLPGLDLDLGFDAFEEGFLLAVAQEPVLQDVAKVGNLQEQTRLQKQTLDVLRQMVAHLRTLPLTEGVRVKDGVVATRGGVAGGEHSFNVGGSIYGNVTIHQHVTVAPSPQHDYIRDYLKRLRDICNVLPLGALGGDEDTEESVRLDQVYISLDTTTQEGEEKIEGTPFSRGLSRPVSALEAATRSKRMVLLGKPGSGKSTFVCQLAARLASAYLGNAPSLEGWEEELVPVLLTLRDLGPRLAPLSLEGRSRKAQDDLLLDALWEQWRYDLEKNLEVEAFADDLKTLLHEGKVVLIFDGLDELPGPLRQKVRKVIGAVRRRYPRVERMIITSRIRSYSSHIELPGFDVYTLAPFDEGKIRSFVEAWYHAQKQLGRMVGKDVTEAIDDLQQAALSAELREMAENPLLLTVMAIIHQKETELPKQRVLLYGEAVKVLMQRWQKHKGLSHDDPRLEAILRDARQLRELLEMIAYKTHQLQASQGKEARLTRGALLEWLEHPKYLGDAGLASSFLDYVDQRAGVLIGQGGDEEAGIPHTYEFAHRSFQEYLAGCWMISMRSRKREYWQRAGEGDFWYLAAMLGAEELFFSKKMSQDLLDLAYDLCKSEPPADEQGWRATLWSGQMAVLAGKNAILADEDAPDGGEAYFQRLLTRLVAMLERSALSPIERADAGNVLARLGDPRPGVGLNAQGLPDILWSEPIEPGPFIMGNTKETDPMAYDDEAPRFTCNLITEPYRISVYPITVAQYRAFVKDAKGYEKSRYWTDAGWKWKERNKISGPYEFGEPFNLDNHPQVGVSWYEAVAFCNWLSEVTGLAIQLPTEAQWERAARHVDSRRYPWDEGLAAPDPNRMNYDETGIGATSAVGIFPAGGAVCGAQDMSGNVWEWCRTKWRDNYENYEHEVDDALEGGALRVLRGGSFNDNGYGVRAAFRHGSGPDLRSGGIGFRVVLLPPFPSDL